jgi:hypothetical protein
VFQEVAPVYIENNLKPINTVHMIQHTEILMQVGLISNIIFGRVLA